MSSDRPGSKAGSDSRFEAVDWDDAGHTSRGGWREVVFLTVVLATVALLLYDYYFVGPFSPLVGNWDPAREDWPFIISLAAFGLYVVVPFIQNQQLTRYYWRRLRRNRLAVAALVWLHVVFVLGLFGPVLVGAPETNPTGLHNPPVGFRVDKLLAGGCVGRAANGYCYGSWAHPLGTTGGGRDVLEYTIAGMHTALQLILITATLLVPIATVVGTVAAYTGGWIDECLMRYVDIQQVIPAFFVYIVLQFVYKPTLTLMVAVFGLLNWGNMARLVRAAVLREREEAYVAAARNAGAGRFTVIRRHLIPNVSKTLVTAATFQLPMLVLIETGLSFLSLSDPDVYSWGRIIAVGMVEFPYYWWIPTFPILALLLTVVSLAILGDALRDVFDPRTAL